MGSLERVGGKLGNILLKYQGILPPLPPPPTCLVTIHKRPLPLFIYIVLCLFFQVGCGAIGCELLKNFALLGIAGSANGMVVFIFIFTFSGMFKIFFIQNPVCHFEF